MIADEVVTDGIALAFLMQRFISRGHFTVDGRSLLMTRGSLADANSQFKAYGSYSALRGGSALLTCDTFGLLMGETELFLLEDDESYGGDREPKEAFGAAIATATNLGLGGGFKRFVFEPF